MTDEPQAVTPQPVPTSFNVQAMQGTAGESVIALSINTPTGVHISFMDRDTALQLASHLRKTAQTGPQLVVPEGNGKLGGAWVSA